MCTRATMTWLPFSLFQHPIMNKIAQVTGADGENGQLPTHALPPHRSIFSWQRQKARSFKRLLPVVKAFFPGVIFTPGRRLYCYAGAGFKIELMPCGVGFGRGLGGKGNCPCVLHGAMWREPTNTTTRVHWVKSKGKTFQFCARIVSYFTSNVRHSKSMGTLWLRGQQLLNTVQRAPTGTGKPLHFRQTKSRGLKKKIEMQL